MRTEDQVRDEAKIILGFNDGEENVPGKEYTLLIKENNLQISTN